MIITARVIWRVKEIMDNQKQVGAYDKFQRVIVLEGINKNKLGSVVECLHYGLPTIYIVKVDGVDCVQYNDKQIRPVQAADFQPGDKVVSERCGDGVVKEIICNRYVRVLYPDGRFYDVLPSALVFNPENKREDKPMENKKNFEPKIVISTNNEGKMVTCFMDGNPDHYVITDYTEETLKEDTINAINALMAQWPAKGDTFYFVKLDNGQVNVVKGQFNPDGNMSKSCVTMGNIYKTEEEAMAAASRVQAAIRG